MSYPVGVISIFNSFGANAIICLAIALFVGLLIAKVMGKFGLPAVTGYLVAGVLLGPYCLGLLDINGIGFVSTTAENASSLVTTDTLNIFTGIALGFIAFGIGNEFIIPQLKKTGKRCTIVAIVQALAATLVVDLSLITLHFLFPDLVSLPVAITLGAVATATAPAATVLLINQYHARGELTSMLLTVVAIDDAVGLVVFAISYGISNSLLGGEVDVLRQIILKPILSVVLSLLLGLVLGALLSFACNFFKQASIRSMLSISAVLIAVAISTWTGEVGGVEIEFSSLLVCMMIGAAFCNISPYAPRILSHVGDWAGPFNIIFFVMSGASMDLSLFLKPTVVIVSVVYMIARCLGKYYGARLSCKATHCSEKVTKYLGITLFPQAGVALGMALIAAKTLGAEMLNVCLFAVLIYELVGPLLSQIALVKAGEIKPENLPKKRRKKKV